MPTYSQDAADGHRKLADATGGVITRSKIADVEIGRTTDISLSAALAIPPEAFAVAAEINAAKARLTGILEPVIPKLPQSRWIV